MIKKPNNFIGLAIALLLLFTTDVFAMYTTYQAKIVKPDGLPLDSATVNFRFTILDPAGSCILYTENFNGINMSNTAGLIQFSLGSGIKTYPVSASVQFSDIFNNHGAALACASGGFPPYAPASTDIRKVVMQFNDGNGWQTLPAMSINHVPYAMYSRNAASATVAANSLRFNGKSDTDFVQYTTIPTCSASNALQFNGATFGCVPVGGSGGGGGSVAVSGTAPLIVTGPASAPMISISVASMSTDGYLTAADYAEFKAKLSVSSTQISNTLGYAPVSSSAVASQIDAAATVSATANSLVKRDASGNGLFTGISAGTANLNYVDIYRPSTSFNIRLQASSSLSSNYVLTLPATSGTAGQVLSTDGLGNLSWTNNGSGGSVTSVSGTAGEISSTGGATPVLGLENVGTAGTFYKVTTDAKGRVTSGVTTLTLSDLPNTLLTTTSNFAGDISGMISNITVNRLQGVSVTITSLTANDILQYDGSKYVNKSIPTCSGSQYLSYNGTSFICNTDAGASGTITTLSVTGPLSSTGGTNPTISISQASNSSNGYLSSGDWTTFNNKITSSAASIAQVLGYVPAASGAVANSQWTTNGTNIFYNTGNVGLGVSVPTNKLDVAGTINVTGGSIITNGWIQGANVTAATYRDSTTFNQLWFPGFNSLALTTGSVERFRITSAGAVGINTTTPVTTLDVSGGLRLSMESAACAANYAGTLRYNSGILEMCNGTSWIAFGVAGAGITNFNGSTSGSQSLANSLTGTAPAFVSANGVHTLNIPYASVATTTAGLISNTDYVNFSTVTNKITSSAASIAEVLGYTPAASGSSASYWIKTGSNVAYSAGSVGIGTGASNPFTVLEVSDTQPDTDPNMNPGTVSIHNKDNTNNNYVFMGFRSNTTTNQNRIAVKIGAQVTARTAGAITGDFVVTPFANGVVNEQFRVTSTGRVGIGTSTPVTALDVTGGLKIGAEAAGCDATYAGTLRYNGGLVQYCNGTTWSSFGVAGAGITNLNGSTSGSQTFANALTGTTPAFLTLNGVHTLNIPFASAGTTTAGLISNSDFVTFSNKLTSSTAAVAQALGYTPANSATVATLSSNLSAVSSTLNTAQSNIAAVSASVSSLASSSAASFTSLTSLANGKITSSAASIAQVLGYVPAASGAMASSQWITSSTTIYYDTGHVGVGTSSPGTTMDIVGGMTRVQGDANFGVYPTTGKGLEFGYNTTSDFGLIASYNRSTTAYKGMYIDALPLTLNGISSANVGVGTLTPQEQLHVGNGTNKFALFNLNNGGAVPASNFGLIIGANNSNFAGETNFWNGSSSATTSFDFKQKTGSATFSTLMTLKASGTVGIGTSSPSDVLHIAGAGRFDGAGAMSILSRFSNGTANSSPGLLLGMAGVVSGGAIQSGFVTPGITSTANLNLQPLGGNVGIGKTTPMATLDVSGGIRISMESATCAASYAGTLRYNGSNVEFCNGTTWSAFGVAGAGVANFNGSTSGTQSFANAAAGTTPAFVTLNGVHTLNIPLASAGSVTAGLLSNVDYTTFMGKITSSAASISQVLGYTPASTTALTNYLAKASNLSDLTSSATARANLGLGGFATVSSLDLGTASATGTLAAARLPAFGGDVVTTAGSSTVTVTGLRGRSVLATAPASGQVLAYNGSAWAPATAGGSSQWTTSGTSIHYTAGNVGIGTTSPSYSFSLQDTVSSVRKVWMNDASNDMLNIQSDELGYTGISFMNTDSYTSVWGLGALSNSTGQGPVKGFAIVDHTAGYTRMVINTSGDVGFGTVYPGAKLHVLGNQGIENNTNSATTSDLNFWKSRNYGNTQNNDELGKVNFYGYRGSNHYRAAYIAAHGEGTPSGSSVPGNLRFMTTQTGATDSVERMRITASGSVGIGTTTPVTRLEVSGGLRISMESAACNASYAGTLRYNTGNVEYCNGSAWASFSASGTDLVRTNNLSDLASSATARANLGLGGFATVSSLDLSTASATGFLAVARLPSFTGDVVSVSGSNSLIVDGLQGRAVLATAPTSGQVLAYNGTDWTPTSTVSKLNILGNAEAQRWDAATGTSHVFSRFYNGTGRLALGVDGSSVVMVTGGTSYAAFVSAQSSSDLILATADTTRFFIKGGAGVTGGYVGIGTTTPSEVLEVSGSVKATSFISTSDRRLKENIQPMTGLQSVLKLNGYSYQWKSDGKYDAGVLAQELEQVFPHAVVTDARTGYKGVKYPYLIAPLIESTKELHGMCTATQKEVDNIRRELASVKDENSKLKDKNKELEDRLKLIEKKLGIK